MLPRQPKGPWSQITLGKSTYMASLSRLPEEVLSKSWGPNRNFCLMQETLKTQARCWNWFNIQVSDSAPENCFENHLATERQRNRRIMSRIILILTLILYMRQIITFELVYPKELVKPNYFIKKRNVLSVVDSIGSLKVASVSECSLRCILNGDCLAFNVPDVEDPFSNSTCVLYPGIALGEQWIFPTTNIVYAYKGEYLSSRNANITISARKKIRA